MTSPSRRAPSPETSVLARLRVPVFTVSSVGLGITAHVAAGGTPPAAALLLMVLAVAAITGVVADHEARLPHLLAGVGAVQVGVHLALSSHAMHQSVSWSMTVAHALAASLVAWWLRRGEVALRRMADRARLTRTLLAFPGVALTASGRTPSAQHRTDAWPSWVGRPPVGRRGPPGSR